MAAANNPSQRLGRVVAETRALKQVIRTLDKAKAKRDRVGHYALTDVTWVYARAREVLSEETWKRDAGDLNSTRDAIVKELRAHYAAALVAAEAAEAKLRKEVAVKMVGNKPPRFGRPPKYPPAGGAGGGAALPAQVAFRT